MCKLCTDVMSIWRIQETHGKVITILGTTLLQVLGNHRLFYWTSVGTWPQADYPVHIIPVSLPRSQYCPPPCCAVQAHVSKTINYIRFFLGQCNYKTEFVCAYMWYSKKWHLQPTVGSWLLIILVICVLNDKLDHTNIIIHVNR